VIPKQWQEDPYFQKLEGLEGGAGHRRAPVVRPQADDGGPFAVLALPLLSVYADMSTTVQGAPPTTKKSMLELVFAPAKDWIGRR